MRQLNGALAALRDHGNSDVVKLQLASAEVFRSIHSLLTHASNVSRLLWPSIPTRGNGESDEAYETRIASKPPIARSRALRSEFGLADDHALTSRELRDQLDHFDEKLDHWRATSVRRNIVNDFIGPVGAIAGIDPTDMMRWFDPSMNRFTFRGEVFDLQAIATGLDSLLPQSVQVEMRMHERLRQEALDARQAAPASGGNGV